MDNFQKVEVQILNAFVDNDRGGNPAGVVLNADDFSHEQRLIIAAKVGLSETAFVSKSGSADFKLDFYTPTKQIAHCGHATIASFSYLSQLGKIDQADSSKETIDGNRRIRIEGELAFMEQKPPVYIDIEHREESVLQSLGLNKNDLPENAPIVVINTGNSFAIIAVKNSDILKNIKPDFDLISAISEEFDLIGYYVFSLDASYGRDATTRMFAPRYGIEEEAGTGMAAGPLACYLYEILGVKKDRLFIEQGWFMKEPSASLIIVDLETDKGKITKLMAGGKGIADRVMAIEI